MLHDSNCFKQLVVLDVDLNLRQMTLTETYSSYVFSSLTTQPFLPPSVRPTMSTTDPRKSELPTITSASPVVEIVATVTALG